MKTTERGFQIYAEFKDTYQSTVRVQESSSIGKACWIFCEDKDGISAKEHLGQLVSTSPHLNKDQAIKLAHALLDFAREE